MRSYDVVMTPSDDGHWVLKSEADKVITLLKDKVNYNECAYKLKSEELADTCRFYEDELRHHKYKRCLCNSKACLYLVWYYDEAGFREASNRMWKWHRRWLKLAEKFKEAK